jgi:hypothetical protein
VTFKFGDFIKPGQTIPVTAPALPYVDKNICPRSGKVRYTKRNGRDIKTHLNQLRGMDPHGTFNPYKCWSCHDWHVGHGDEESRMISRRRKPR